MSFLWVPNLVACMLETHYGWRDMGNSVVVVSYTDVDKWKLLKNEIAECFISHPRLSESVKSDS
jgi:hypothetical protein